MHRYLRIRKFLEATISSSEFISIPTNKKFTKAVSYIHDNNSWERCYVLLKIIFPCLRVIYLADSNLAVMEKFITIRELPSSEFKKQYLILIIRDYSLTYSHQPIYGTSQMTKVMKNSQYKNIIPCIQKENL